MIRRLILRLDACSGGYPELAVYAALAHALDAELLTQLEDDERLNTLATLPFITEICRTNASPRPLNRESLERHSEQLIQQLRNQLEAISRQTPLRWQLTRVNRLEQRNPEPDSAMLRTCHRQHQPSPAAPSAIYNSRYLTVLHGGDDGSDRALDYARQISQRQQLPILLLALPDSPWHRSQQLPAGVSAVADMASCEPTVLRSLLRAWHSQLLLIPAQRLTDMTAADSLSEQLPGITLLLTP